MPLLHVRANLKINNFTVVKMKPIQLDFKPSILASGLFTLMSLGALAIVMLLAFSWQIKLLLSSMIIASAIYALLCHGLLLLPWSYVALKINMKNQLQLKRKNGQVLEVTAQPNSVVTPYLTVLNSCVKDATFMHRLLDQHLIIFPDAVNADDYRQLRVWLRWAYARQPE
jgi:toxin CptA